MTERRHQPVFGGFREMSRRRQELASDLVAARMGTSQSAVARLESGDADIRLSTLDRYAAALGRQLGWSLR